MWTGSLMTILGDSSLAEWEFEGGGVRGRDKPVLDDANCSTAVGFTLVLEAVCCSSSRDDFEAAAVGSGFGEESFFDGLEEFRFREEAELVECFVDSVDEEDFPFDSFDRVEGSLFSFLSDFFDEDWFLFLVRRFLNPFIISGSGELVDCGTP